MSSIRRVGLAIFAIISIAAVFLSMYYGWRLLRVFWAPVLFFANLAFGILVVLAGRRRVRKTLSDRNNPDALRVALVGRLGGDASKLRSSVTGALGVLIIVTGGWLYALVHGLIMGAWAARDAVQGARDAGAKQTLLQEASAAAVQGVFTRFAPITLALVLVAYAAARRAPDELPWIKAFLAVALANTLFRHLHYTIGSVPLPVQLRRTLGNPYVWFLVIAASDLLTLSLTLNALLSWDGGVGGSHENVLKVTGSLLFASLLKVLEKIVEGTWPSPTEAVITGIGLIYYTTIFETIHRLEISKLRRTDEDHWKLAANFVASGWYAHALKTLEQIRDIKPPQLVTRAAAYLGAGRPDLAWADATAAIRGETKGDAGRGGPDEIFGWLTQISAQSALPPGALVELLKHGIALSLSDFDLALAVRNFLVFGGVDAATGRFRNADAIRIVFHDEAAASRYPVARAALLAAQAPDDEADHHLVRIEPEDAAAAFLRQLRILELRLNGRGGMSLEEKRSYFEVWTRENFHAAAALAADSGLYRRGVLLGIIGMLAQAGADLGWTGEVSWSDLTEETKRMLTEESGKPEMAEELTNLLKRVGELSRPKPTQRRSTHRFWSRLKDRVAAAFSGRVLPGHPAPAPALALPNGEESRTPGALAGQQRI